MEGNIFVDTISTLNMMLSESSIFTGTINVIDNAQNGTSVSDNAVIALASGSIWTLTGDSVITALTINDDAQVVIPAGISLTINGNTYTDLTLTADSTL